MTKINPGQMLKYLTFTFVIISVVFATLYKRYDTFLLGIGVGLLVYGSKLNMTTALFIGGLAIFLGSYLPFGISSTSIIQGFTEGFADAEKDTYEDDLKEVENLSQNILDKAEKLGLTEKISKDSMSAEFQKEMSDKQKEIKKLNPKMSDKYLQLEYAKVMADLTEKLLKKLIKEMKQKNRLDKQKEYIDSENTTVPEYCGKLGVPSADNLIRLYKSDECLKISATALNNGESKSKATFTDDGRCVWLGYNKEGKLSPIDDEGPSYECARLNVPEPTTDFSKIYETKRIKVDNEDLDYNTEDQGYYYSKFGKWHQGPELIIPKDDDLPKVKEGFENQNTEKKKTHLPPPDNANRREMFELGKKYELPKETDDPEFHLDAGTTFLNAYKSLNPDQLSAMSKDTLDLINTQKQLMSTLNTLKPLISDGKQMMDTFQNYFGNSGGNMGDLSKLAEQFAATK